MIVLLFIASANLELACIERDNCDAIAEKLRLYSKDQTITIVAAHDITASERTLFRITINAQCDVEILPLLADTPARTAQLACDNPRSVALHIASELQSDFAAALAALESQPRRTRVAKSSLLPASAPTARAPIRVVPEPPPPEAPPPAPRFSLLALAHVSGLADIVSAGGSFGFTYTHALGLGGEVGLRADLRSPLPSPRGAIAFMLLVPYMRLHWRFQPHPRIALLPSLHGELPIGLVQLADANRRTFVMGAIGPALRARFPFIPNRLALVFDIRALVSFEELQLGPERPHAPFLWGASSGLEVFF